MQTTITDVSGKPGPDPKVTHEEILREMQLAYAPISTPKQLAQRLDISNTAMSGKLGDMEDKGWVESENVGSGKVYWLTDVGKRQIDPAYDSDSQ